MFTLARRSPFEWMEQMERRFDGILGRFFEQGRRARDAVDAGV
jgi:hypothetical protein